jgi:16S rRNA (guanine527-N7)-methyltransferase
VKPGEAPVPEKVIGDAAGLGVRLSLGQAERLLRYRELLLSRAVPMGLVAEGDAPRLYRRHLLDCLAAASAFLPADRFAYDLGSGAGLPGIVLAVALPGVRFVLVESRSKRAGFLELAAEFLGLGNVEVLVARAESVRDGADVATARAFAPLERSWEAARGLLRRGGRLLYFAGRGVAHPERAGASLADVAQISLLDSSTTLVIMSRT